MVSSPLHDQLQLLFGAQLGCVAGAAQKVSLVDRFDEAPVRHHRDAVADRRKFGKFGRDEDDGLALGSQGAHEAQYFALRADVDAGRGFIHDENVGIGRQPLADDDLLLIAAREGVGRGPARCRFDGKALDQFVGCAA
jgi:hypothetical protein